MESVLKVGRTVSDGVCRAAGLLARGARRILAVIPLLGIAAPADDDDTAVDNATVRPRMRVHLAVAAFLLARFFLLFFVPVWLGVY